jgi:hypothetical protein
MNGLTVEGQCTGGWLQVVASVDVFDIDQQVLDFFAPGAGYFLDATNELLFLAFDVTKIVIGQAGIFLLQFSFGDMPVSF